MVVLVSALLLLAVACPPCLWRVRARGPAAVPMRDWQVLMFKQVFFKSRRQGLAILMAAVAYACSSIPCAARTFAFDFEIQPKEENFRLFDFTIVDPMAEVDLSIAHNAGHKVIAYISVGEVGE